MAAAHFLMKCMFCLFVEDIDLLPNDVFTRILEKCHADPARFHKNVAELFTAMRSGGEAFLENILRFNGGLFDDAPPLPLTADDLLTLKIAADKDWSAVEPSIFGTLFERALDPNKRAQIGAHYTSRDDILLVVEPVIMQSLRREWAEARQKLDKLLLARSLATRERQRGAYKKGARTPEAYTRDITRILAAFRDHLSHLKVLDPACGSGNFLYVALQQLLNLEKEVITYAATAGVPLVPLIRPTQLLGIEINRFAAELAQVVIWIGYLQWMRDNGFNAPRDPILDKLQTIENRDAILAFKEGGKLATAAQWPDADFIVGILAWERNRLARPKDPVDGLMLERALIKAGKRVFYVATGQEADRSFASGLISYVEHYQNGDYLRKLSRDTMRGHVARAERGLWCGGPIPFGYDRLYLSLDGRPKRIVRDMSDRTQHVIHPETRETLEIIPAGQRCTKSEFELCTLTLSDPVRVRAVQRMFTDYANGLPLRVIRDALNASGLRTARGRIFTLPSIHSMIANPAYTGTSFAMFSSP